ncbi:hypothetical protein FOA43_000910 [Brettanomyces nanus]|uniref:Holocytochrome c-type synthase n=1 Tax=Eeniella nana TaxID=13502 RepID=A0A875RY44_EENNA|nr:uncharacterized protein FOA43_000910 [Brettanomyces nanus]QPG73598.1 hypothetical protein FOA43_000910 [Brettanomyces nanus]
MSSSEGKCPIDEKTREIWLEKARAAKANKALSPELLKHIQIHDGINPTMPEGDKTGTSFSWMSLFWANPRVDDNSTDFISRTDEVCPVSDKDKRLSTVTANYEAVESCSSENMNELEAVDELDVSKGELSDQRQISSIPRTGEDSNWIYPSQKQFYKAMKRKQWEPESEDMKTVVPLHNLVNEVAWDYIQQWEEGQGGLECGGIKLTSFKGNSHKLTPRALFRHYVFGHELPFDRHDWTIDRCGKNVDYVIDFYSKTQEKGAEPTFYLDVRPKLNSVEGWRLRVVKALERK